MKSRDLGVLVFGLAGLYSLLLGFGAAMALLAQFSKNGLVVEGQLHIQAAYITAVVNLLLHLAFGAALLGGRRRLARWLLDDDGPAGAGVSAALGFAAAGVCALAILLLSRSVTALSYGTSLLFVRSNEGDFIGMTIGGILVDLLAVAAGLLLIVKRRQMAAFLLEQPADEGRAPTPARRPLGTAGTPGDPEWQLPAMRFLGLSMVVVYLPSLTSALAVFVKWWLRPIGFDIREQAIDRIPPAATGVIAGLYFFLLFPDGMSAVWRWLRRFASGE
jgi:hypothetical protein